MATQCLLYQESLQQWGHKMATSNLSLVGKRGSHNRLITPCPIPKMGGHQIATWAPFYWGSHSKGGGYMTPT